MPSVADLVPSLAAILPLLVLTGWACVLLLVDLFIPAGRKGITAGLSALGLLISLVLGLLLPFSGGTSSATSAFGGMLVVDGFARFLSALLLCSGLAGVGLAYDYLKRAGIQRSEYYTLLLFSIVGMILMGMAADLILVFLALELLSIPLYVLAGIAVPRLSSEEASLKYFLLGAFSSGFVVFGTALVYGASGTTSLSGIRAFIGGGVSGAQPGDSTLLLAGVGLVLTGLAFKVALAPFHMWTPDVYQGAPTPVTAFMAIGAKAAGFAALLRLFVIALPGLASTAGAGGPLTPILWTLAALTMLLGNLVAIAQTNIKRLLAYSSIAHAGYMLMALVSLGRAGAAVTPDAVASALFYLLAYAFANFAAWAVVIALEQFQPGAANGEAGLRLEDYAGLGRKHPALAAAMAVAMLSFIGVPPTLGFMGKFYLFRTAVEAGFLGLALVGVFTSLISAYYYLRVVVVMYMRPGEPQVRSEGWLQAIAFVAAAGTVILSIIAAPLLSWAAQALLALF